MPDPTPSTDTGAPAPTGPEGDVPQVQIALGPDQSIYPESLRPRETPPAPPVEAPEPEESTASDTLPESAGAEISPDTGESRGTRRRAADEAYRRGLAEGRAKYEQEQAQRAERDRLDQTQREASARVEQLFDQLESTDYATQDRARREVLQMYRGNRQAAALQQVTRQQILAEMAQDFSHLRDLEGVDDAGYQSLHTAPSAAELGKRAFELGQKSRDDQVRKLEAELQGLRGRLVGSRATPERANGASPGIGNISLEQYLAMSPKEARALSPSQVDALTAQLAAEAANGRS